MKRILLELVLLSTASGLSFGPSRVLTALSATKLSNGEIISRDEKTIVSAPRPTGFKFQDRTGADINAWRNGFTTVRYEVTIPTVVQPNTSGLRLPLDMTAGTYLRNGYGRFESDDGVIATHPFDADGHITAITMDPSAKEQVLFRNRFVQTAAYLNDKATGKMTGRGIFGTKKSGGFFSNLFDLTYKNVGNTNVLYMPENQTLYALWEGGMPHVLDPVTLENKKLKDFKSKGQSKYWKTNEVTDNLCGILSDQSPAFSAHPRYDPRSDTWCNFACAFDPTKGKTVVRLFELHASNMTSVGNKHVEVSFEFEGSGLLHDFFITENYLGFALNTASIDSVGGLKAALGVGAFAGAMKFDNDKSTTPFVLIPRLSNLLDLTPPDQLASLQNMDVFKDERIKVIDVPYFFNFHFSNAFESEEGHVVVDSVQSKLAELGADKVGGKNIGVWDLDPFVLEDMYPTKLVRWTLDPKTYVCALGVPSPQVLVGDRACEFPIVPRQLSSQNSKFAYMVGSHKSIGDTNDCGGAPAGALIKADASSPGKYECFAFESYEFPGEAAFVPKTSGKAEDSGYLLCLVVNGRDMTTDLVVLDVEGNGALEKGPVVRYTLPTFVPHGLHGSFVEGLTNKKE